MDYNRRFLEWYSYYPYESQLGVGNVLNCSYKSWINLQSAGTDGKIIGDTRWSWTGYVPGVVIFTGTPKSINFGTVLRNTSKTDTIVVSSDGGSALVIDSVKSSAMEFNISPSSASINAGSSRKFVVTFTPTSAGSKSGKIVLYHNGISKADSVGVTGNGSLTSVGNLENAIPKVYQLHENFPNPFNPSITIQYDLPKQSVVTLKIYSLLGQEVTTLVNDIQLPGYHQITWMGKNDGGKMVSSGVYFIRMFAKPIDKGQTFTHTKKMLLMK